MIHASIVLWLGFAALGAVIGWLTGWSGTDDTVLAATLPAILSVVGGAIGALALKSSGPDRGMLGFGGFALLAFSLSLGAGTHFGGWARVDSDRRGYLSAENAQAEKDKHERQERVKWQEYALPVYHRRLQACAQAEVVINDTRQKLGLPELGPGDVCPPYLIQMHWSKRAGSGSSPSPAPSDR